MFKGKTEFDPQAKEQLFKALGSLNDFLTGQQWVAGNDLSIADFALVTTVATIFVRSTKVLIGPDSKLIKIFLTVNTVPERTNGKIP